MPTFPSEAPDVPEARYAPTNQGLNPCGNGRGEKIPATSAAESSAGQKSPDFSMEAAAYCDVQTELALEQPDRGKVTFQN